MTATPSRRGIPRSSRTRSGCVCAARAMAAASVRRGDDLVAVRAQGDAQGAHELRVVVGDEDLHGGLLQGDGPHALSTQRRRAARSLGRVDPASATGSSTTIVSPPPGVSSGVSVPPMPSTNPRDRARPRPRPVVLSVSPRRWKGAKMSLRRSGGDARAVVDRRGSGRATPGGSWRCARARPPVRSARRWRGG